MKGGGNENVIKLDQEALAKEKSNDAEGQASRILFTPKSFFYKRL